MKILDGYFKKQKKKIRAQSLDIISRNLRYVSVGVAELLNSMGISPNNVTIFRFLVFGSGSAVSFFIGGNIYNFVGLTLLFLCYFFDLVDGDLARNFDRKTKLGEFLDTYLDAILINFILVSISLNLFSIENPLRFFSLFAIMGQALSSEVSKIYERKFGISCVKVPPPKIEKMFQKTRIDFMSNSILELLSPRHIYTSVFSTVRYYLIAGALFGVLPIAIAIYSIAINFRWAMLFIVLCIYSTTEFEKKQYLFKVFESIENNRQA